MSSASFIKAIVWGNIGVANCSMDTMCQLLNEAYVIITKQDLDVICSICNGTNKKELFLPIIEELSKFIACFICLPSH